MLSREENELITRVGPGTPMGDVWRRYWIIAGVSREIPTPGSPPVRVRLLGEDLLLFRDTNGKVGLIGCSSTAEWQLAVAAQGNPALGAIIRTPSPHERGDLRGFFKSSAGRSFS